MSLIGPKAAIAAPAEFNKGLAVVDEHTTMEHRSAPRYMISDCTDLKLKLWLVGAAPDLTKKPIEARLWDLSEEGASFICPWDRTLLSLPAGQPLELSITYKEFDLRLDGALIHSLKVGGRAVTLGMSFRDTLRGFEGKAQIPSLLEQLMARGLTRAVAGQSA